MEDGKLIRTILREQVADRTSIRCSTFCGMSSKICIVVIVLVICFTYALCALRKVEDVNEHECQQLQRGNHRAGSSYSKENTVGLYYHPNDRCNVTYFVNGRHQINRLRSNASCGEHMACMQGSCIDYQGATMEIRWLNISEPQPSFAPYVRVLVDGDYTGTDTVTASGRHTMLDFILTLDSISEDSRIQFMLQNSNLGHNFLGNIEIRFQEILETGLRHIVKTYYIDRGGIELEVVFDI